MKTWKFLFLKVLDRLSPILEVEGVVSAYSSSLMVKVGISMQTMAITERRPMAMRKLLGTPTAFSKSPAMLGTR